MPGCSVLFPALLSDSWTKTIVYFGKRLGPLARGGGVVYGVAFVLSLIQYDFPLTAQIYDRTAPNRMDSMIALGAVPRARVP